MSKKPTDRGAAAVEFALVLPILIALLLGIIEFGYAMFIQATIAGAAREGARTLAIAGTASSATSAAIQAAEDGALPAVTLNAAQITADNSQCSSDPSSAVTVTIRYPYTGIAGILPGGITISGTGVMRCGG
ncbi:MAG: pilus assembly protein [Propionibacterium sp.]|nr:pilus assembly protein [Propionibacterium sp.]